MAVNSTGGGGGGGGSAGAVRAGAAFVELFAEDNALYRALARAEARVKQWAAAVGRAGAGLFGVGAAGYAALDSLEGLATSRGTEIGRLAAKLGVPTDELSAFAYAAETTGISLEDLKGHFENFQERVAQAAQGTGEAADTFRTLNLDARKLALENPVRQMTALADAMGPVANETQRLGMLSQLGGDQFQWLNTLLRLGSSGIGDRMRTARDIGAIVTPREAAAAQEAAAAYHTLAAALKAVAYQVGVALLPSDEFLRRFVGTATDAAASARRFVQANPQAVQAAEYAVYAVLGLGAAGLAAAGGLAVAGTAVGGLAAPVTLLAGAVGFLLTPAGALAAVLGLSAGLIAATAAETGDLRAGLDYLGQAAAGFGRTFADTWSGVTAALDAGDLDLAGRTAFAGLEVAWAQTVLHMRTVWTGFTTWLADALAVSADTIADIWADVLGQVTDRLSEGDPELRATLDQMEKQAEKDRKEKRDKAVAANKAAAEAALAPYQQAVKDAESKLSRLKADADFAWLLNELSTPKAGGPDGGKRLPTPDAIVGAVRGGTAGGFGNSLGLRFGLADTVGKQLLAAQKGTEKNTADTAKKVGEAADAIDNLARGLIFQ